ncbi:MAG: c-type cytochrome [Nitrospirota bacterium]|nr:c-type cytochrome [Nitrospirota bacterium]
MGNFTKIIIFSILIVLAYPLYVKFGIPKLNPSPPPVEAEIGANMTMDQFIALGKKIFDEKGTCTLCHNSLGRAPMLNNQHSVALDRLKDPRYKGGAKTAEEYLHESMIKTSAFVVAGFGVKGSNDTQSPMPDVSTGAIGLNPAEIDAVIAYMMTKDGGKTTLTVPTAVPAAGAEEKKPAAPAKTGAEVVKKYGCGGCHVIAGEAGALGPDLSKIGSKGKDYLRQAVVDPDAVVAKGFDKGMMPTDYKDKMTAGELEMLVDLMAKSK